MDGPFGLAGGIGVRAPLVPAAATPRAPAPDATLVLPLGDLAVLGATGKAVALAAGVTSVNASGGTTGLSFSGGPITTSGTLTLGGTLGIANGGTGAVGPVTVGMVPIATNLGAAQWATLTAGAGISVTNASGSVTLAFDPNGLTAADPAFADQLAGYDASAGAARKFEVDYLLGLQPATPGGRLTALSGNPAGDTTGGGTLYYQEYLHDRITLWDGTRWVTATFSGVSIALSGLTSGKNYDVFAYLSAGAVALEIGPVWTNDTTRGTAIVRSDGRLVKTGDKTRLYLGTFRATGAATTNDNATNRFIWNCYNRVRRHLSVTDTTDSWTYGSAAWRYANNTSANRVELVRGLDEDTVEAVALGYASVTSTSAYCVGVGVSSNTANSAQVRQEAGTLNASDVAPTTAVYKGQPGVGYYYLAWIEYARAGTPTAYGDAGVVTIQSGLEASVWA